MSTTGNTDEPRRHRFTVEDYYLMGEVGILRSEERVELIEGETSTCLRSAAATTH